MTLENRQLTEEGKSLEKNRAEQTHFCTLEGGKKGRFHASRIDGKAAERKVLGFLALLIRLKRAPLS